MTGLRQSRLPDAELRRRGTGDVKGLNNARLSRGRREIIRPQAGR